MSALKRIDGRQKELIDSIVLEFPFKHEKISPAILEKDFLIRDVIHTIMGSGSEEARLIFCGGTCLSMGHGIIDRMSEDIDFKVVTPSDMGTSQRDRTLSAFKKGVIKKLEDSGFWLIPDSLRARNSNGYITANFGYESVFGAIPQSLRPEIKIEFTANPPHGECNSLALIPTADRMMRKMGGVPEGKTYPITCLGLEETAAEKVISYLRRTAQERAGLGRGDYDSYLVRHFYDLHQIMNSGCFTFLDCLRLFEKIVDLDRRQFGRQFMEFQTRPFAVLEAERRYLKNDSSSRESYNQKLIPLVWGDRPSFEMAVSTFDDLAERLLAPFWEEELSSIQDVSGKPKVPEPGM